MREGTLGVIIVWHMHQPYYGIGGSRCLQMPWVRLHRTKDYCDMASILSDHPGVKVTFNFTPCVLKQLSMYTEDGATDSFLELCLRDAEKLHEEERASLQKLLFLVNPKAIHRFPRYRDLHRKYQDAKGEGEKEVVFRSEELTDLQLLFNLAWFDPSYLSDPRLKALVEKGRGFKPEGMHAIRDKTYEVLAEIIPLYKKLSEEGRIELSSSPYYHPILPLLIDTDVAGEAFPQGELPQGPFQSPEDAGEQISRAIDYHKEIFGIEPKGMWPSEGSVSHDLVPHFIEAGIAWVATDEVILFRSLEEKWVERPPREKTPPTAIYRPCVVEHEGQELVIFFRDNYLSDQIGFTYFNMDLDVALEHFKSYLKTAREDALGAGIESPVLTIVVDGENPWENYDNDGLDFLHGIYRILEEDPLFSAITPSDYIDHVRDHEIDLTQLHYLSPGSWIGGDFRIWIGHRETNTAWERLKEARDYLVLAGQREDIDPERLRRAWEEIYIAEGSDWFWWYGDDFIGEMDAEFGRLFRIHLIRVYELMGDEPPDKLYQPISASNDISTYTAHRSLSLSVRLDGEISSFYEWNGARCYKTSHGCALGEDEWFIEAIHWGCSRDEVLLRCDIKCGAALEPDFGISLTIFSPRKQSFFVPVGKGAHDIVYGGRVVGRYFFGKILEVAIPFSSFDLKEGEREITFNLKEKRGDVMGATHPLGELFRIGL